MTIRCGSVSGCRLARISSIMSAARRPNAISSRVTAARRSLIAPLRNAPPNPMIDRSRGIRNRTSWPRPARKARHRRIAGFRQPSGPEASFSPPVLQTRSANRLPVDQRKIRFFRSSGSPLRLSHRLELETMAMLPHWGAFCHPALSVVSEFFGSIGWPMHQPNWASKHPGNARVRRAYPKMGTGTSQPMFIVGKNFTCSEPVPILG